MNYQLSISTLERVAKYLGAFNVASKGVDLLERGHTINISAKELFETNKEFMVIRETSVTCENCKNIFSVDLKELEKGMFVYIAYSDYTQDFKYISKIIKTCGEMMLDNIL